MGKYDGNAAAEAMFAEEDDDNESPHWVPRTDGTVVISKQHQPYVPIPVDRPDAQGPLSREELGDLADCEKALEHFRRSFVWAGKALAAIRSGRLYRATHDTFEEYCEDRWAIKRNYANKLILAWPLGEKLILGTTVPKPFESLSNKSGILARHKPVNERQVRALLPVAKHLGLPVAVSVYEAVESAEVPVTEKLLRDVSGHITAFVKHPDQLEPGRVAELVTQVLAGDIDVTVPGPRTGDIQVTGSAEAAEAELDELTRRKTVQLKKDLREWHKLLAAGAVLDAGVAMQLASLLRRTADLAEKAGQLKR